MRAENRSRARGVFPDPRRSFVGFRTIRVGGRLRFSAVLPPVFFVRVGPATRRRAGHGRAMTGEDANCGQLPRLGFPGGLVRFVAAEKVELPKALADRPVNPRIRSSASRGLSSAIPGFERSDSNTRCVRRTAHIPRPPECLSVPATADATGRWRASWEPFHDETRRSGVTQNSRVVLGSHGVDYEVPRKRPARRQ